MCSLPDGKVVAAVADVDEVAYTEDLTEHGCLCAVTEIACAIGSIVPSEEIEMGANTLCHLCISGGDEIGGIALLSVLLDQFQHGMVVRQASYIQLYPHSKLLLEIGSPPH